MNRLTPATLAVRTGIDRDPAHGAVMPPLYLSSNFSFAGFGAKRRYDYSRTANPTRDLTAEAIAELEGGQGAVVTASGMAAITLIAALLQPGDVLIAPHDCYGGSYRLFAALARRGNFSVEFVDFSDRIALTTALALRPKLVWIETPSNPLLRITDIGLVADLARRADALVVVDNTFLSPALQRPLQFGADLVVHSTTKYLNGHSDVVGGAVVWRDPALGQELAWWANCLGLTGAPFDSYLTLRGIRTLALRMRQHQDNAGALATVAERHPAVARVYWPGLLSHAGHALAQRQQAGFGAMLSIDLVGGEDAVRALCANIGLFTLAESLGGVESLVAHPATMTHAAMDEAARQRAGIGPGLLRISPGIEATEDLVLDLLRGLDAAGSAQTADTRRVA